MKIDKTRDKTSNEINRDDLYKKHFEFKLLLSSFNGECCFI